MIVSAINHSRIVCVSYKVTFRQYLIGLRMGPDGLGKQTYTTESKYFGNLKVISLYCNYLTKPGADPHRFPPFYGNRSDFS